MYTIYAAPPARPARDRGLMRMRMYMYNTYVCMRVPADAVYVHVHVYLRALERALLLLEARLEPARLHMPTHSWGGGGCS